MTINRLTLTSALLIGVAQITLVPVLSAECSVKGIDCLPPSPEYCDKDSTDRVCGPLRDASAVEINRLEPNLEKAPVPENLDGFRVSIDGAPTDATVAPHVADQMRAADVAAPALKVGAAADLPTKTLIQADTLHVEPMLSVVTSRPYVAPGDTIKFFTHSNYARFTDRAEILIYRSDDSRDAAPHTRLTVKIGETALFTPSLGEEGNYRFVLRVYAPSGRWDETLLQNLRVTRAKEGSDKDERTGPLFENQRIVSNIRVKGATVRVSGTDVPQGATVDLFGAAVPVSSDGKFVAEQIVPEGVNKVTYTVRAADGTESKIVRPVEIKKADRFFVAIGDITAGHRGINNDAAYAELQGTGKDIDTRNDYVDGRFAFYYKGKLNDRYKVTASADTGEQPLKDLFNQFGDKDPRSLLRRLDPDRHYPVYGDDSTTTEDAPTYGRFYFRVEDQNSELMWGNFQTNLAGSELVQFSRGLYGGKLGWRSEGMTSFGEKKTDVTGFAADPGTIGTREEYQSTGGSLYYLRRQDVVQGSERVFVETRDRDSGLVLERRELVPARDYEVNYLQGRLLLRQSLPITAETSQFVRGASLRGNPVFIVMNYEYSPGLTALKTFTVGGRASQWFGDHVRLGGTAYSQGQDQAKQDLYGGDITLRYKPGTYVKGEFAKSSGAGDATTVSGSGGYEFFSVAAAGGKADAYTVEAAADLAELGRGRGRVAAYWRQRGAGFSGPGQLTGAQGVEQFGGNFDIALGSSTALVGKADIVNTNLADRKALEAGVSHDFGSGLFAKAGVRSDSRDAGFLTASPTLNENGSRTDGAITIGYRSNGHVPKRGTPEALFDIEREREVSGNTAQPGAGDSTRSRPWSVYGFGQSTLDSGGNRKDNDRYGVGGDVQLDQRTRMSAEVSDGKLGSAIDIGGEYIFSERGSLNLSYALAAENPDSFTTGRLGRLTATTRYRFTDSMSVFGEGRYDHGSGPTGLTQAYGVDFAPAESWRFGIRYERGDLSDALTGDIKRDAFGANVDYTGKLTRWSTALEYRDDKGNIIGNRSTWAVRNTLTVTPNDSWRVFGKANMAFSHGPNSNQALNANYYEFVAATAFRPVTHDRLNLLAKYTYLYDLPTGGLTGVANSGQLSGRGQSIDFAQRNHVLAIDGTYQINRWLSLGGKYAFRTGQLRPSRDESAQWFSSTANFWAVRADVRVIKEWDAMAEVRKLSISQAKDSRLGALVGVYRHLGENFKVGVGYNFTDYSDDLTDLSYNEKGVFFNVIAKF